MANVLKPYHKDYICSLIAEYKAPSEIEKLFKTKYKMTIWPQQIARIKKKDLDLINKTRALYLQDLMEIPIAQKRIRLERADKQYEEASKIENVKSRIDIRLRCLARSQEEMEGKTKLGDTFLNFQQNNIFSEMTDEQLIKEQKKILSRIKNIKLPKVVEVESDA